MVPEIYKLHLQLPLDFLEVTLWLGIIILLEPKQALD